MDLSFNLAPSNRDLNDLTSRQNFDDTVEQKRVIDLRACHMTLVCEDGPQLKAHKVILDGSKL